MDTQTLSRAVITVQNIYPAKEGRKSGTIKDTEGLLFSDWAQKLGQYRLGETYHVEFTEKVKDGVTYRDIKRAVPTAAPAPMRGQFETIDNTPRQNGKVTTEPEPRTQHGSHIGTRKQEYWQPKPADPATAKRIFICGLVNAWAHNGRIDMTIEAVSEAVRIAGEAYDQMLGEG